MSCSPSATGDIQNASEEWPEDCLLVLLRPQLVLGWAEKYPIRRLVLEDTSCEHAPESVLFFYDWLRNAEGDLLGVRCYPGGESLSSAAELEYVKARHCSPEHCGLEIFFSEDREFEPEHSGDQQFTYNDPFQSKHGESIIAFGSEVLSESDRIRL